MTTHVGSPVSRTKVAVFPRLPNPRSLRRARNRGSADGEIPGAADGAAVGASAARDFAESLDPPREQLAIAPKGEKKKESARLRAAPTLAFRERRTGGYLLPSHRQGRAGSLSRASPRWPTAISGADKGIPAYLQIVTKRSRAFAPPAMAKRAEAAERRAAMRRRR